MRRAGRNQHVPHKSVPMPLLAAGELRQVGLGQCFRRRHGVSPSLVMVAAAAATLASPRARVSKEMGAAGEGDHPPVRAAAGGSAQAPLLRGAEDRGYPGRGGLLAALPFPARGAEPHSLSSGRIAATTTKKRAYGPERRLRRENNSPAPRSVKRVAVERQHSAAAGGTWDPTTPGERFIASCVRDGGPAGRRPFGSVHDSPAAGDAHDFH
jgi:hypothetical protein